jgi:hypothetical protein
MAPHWKCGSRQRVGGSNPPLSAIRSPRGSGLADVVASARSLTHVRVRSLACSPPPWPDPPARRAGSVPALADLAWPALSDPRPRSRTVGVRSLACSPPGSGPAGPRRRPSGYTQRCRARRGTSGALYLQSAPAGLNSSSRSPCSEAAAPGDVEDRVPRSGESRTVSGPEGSSTQRSSSGAADRPGPSRLRQRARVAVDRQGVHGIFSRRLPGIGGAS